jgi:hypothetical protein
MKTDTDFDLNNLKKTINDKTEKNSKNIKKDKKHKCIGSKHIVVKEDAFKDITEKKLDVYIIEVKDNKTDEIKELTYRRCSRPATVKNNSDDQENSFCISHSNSKSYLNFNDDIVPFENTNISKNGIKSTLATGNERYFEKVRNNTKKSISYTFKNNDNPVLLVLNNSILSNKLSLYAIKLLNENKNLSLPDKNNNKSRNSELTNTLNNLNKNYELDRSFNKVSLLNNNNDTLDNLNIKNKLYNKDFDNDDLDNDDLDNDESINDNLDNKKLDNEDSDNIEIDNISILSDEEIIEENDSTCDSEEETECTLIETNKGKTLYLDNEKNIFESEDGIDAIQIGKLTEVNKKYSTILYKSKNYSVIKDIKCPETNNDLKLCVLTDKLFDVEFKHIGKIKKKNNNNFDIILNKKV